MKREFWELQYHEEPLSLARHILKQDGTRLPQTALRRAVGSVYYVLFHALAKDEADCRLVRQNAPMANMHGDKFTGAWNMVRRGMLAIMKKS